MTTLADRQAEFCSYFAPAYPMRSAAAIGGNGTQENLCQPVTVGAKDHGSDGALQWRAERLDGPDGLKPWCAAQGIPWDTLRSQALFTMHELDQPRYAVLKADLKAGAKSLETLTLNFCDAFERPSAAGRMPDARIRFAHDCLTILVRNGAAFPAPASPIPPGTDWGTPTTKWGPPAAPSIPTPNPIGACTMPIELIIQLVAPLAESLISGLLKGALTHAQQTGTIPAPPIPIALHPASAASGLTPADFAVIASMIEKALAALNQPKGIGIGPNS